MDIDPRIPITVLYCISAVLPVAGLLGLYRLARLDRKRLSDGAKDPDDVNTWMVAGSMNVLLENARDRPRAVIGDIAVIGAGLVCAVAASIWSLYI